MIKHDELPASRDIDDSYRIERPQFEQWLQRQYQLTRQSLIANPHPARRQSHWLPPAAAQQ